MALFKIFRGEKTQLDQVKKHDGYAYFTSDTGELFIDVGNEEEEDSKRIQVNSLSAKNLSSDGTTIEIDDIVLRDTIETGALALGKSKEEGGITGLLGVGALFASTSGAPSFGTLPILHGGTGATTVEVARQNLSVYDKATVDTKVASATTVSYTKILSASNWQSEGEVFVQTISLAELRCGADGNVPPIITFSDNQEEYSKIEKADATPGEGIKFTIKEVPESDIKIIILDVA